MTLSVFFLYCFRAGCDCLETAEEAARKTAPELAQKLSELLTDFTGELGAGGAKAGDPIASRKPGLSLEK